MAKHSPLAEIHAELDAKMIPFAGWNMPANYPGGSVAEHKYTRKYCSLFDGSCCGKIRAAGPGCVPFLAPLAAENIPFPAVGECADTFLFDDNGKLADAVKILRMAEEDCFIVTSPENTVKVLALLQTKSPSEVSVQDLTDPIARLTLAGPAARQLLIDAGAEAETVPLSGHCGMTEITDIRCIISSGSVGGEPGFELFCSADNVIDLWDELTCIEPVRPAGISTKESLRIEAGIPAFGQELIQEFTRADLSGQENSAQFFIVPVTIEGKTSAVKGSPVFDAAGAEIGVVTSATQAPCLETPCALCRLTRFKSPGEKIFIRNAGTELTGTVVQQLYTSAQN